MIKPAPFIISTTPLSMEALSMEALSTEADGSSVTSVSVSNASKAFMVATQLRSEPGWRDIANSVGNSMSESCLPGVQIIDDFIVDVASITEGTGPYSKDADSTQSLEQLHEIIERATQFWLGSHHPSGQLRVGSTEFQLPAADGMSSDVFERNLFGHLF